MGYVLALVTETPKDMQKMFDGVVTKVKTWGSKTDEMDSTMKAWEQIKEGKDISIESLEAVINSEKSRESKQLVEETAANDKRIKEKSSLFESLPPLPKEENVEIAADETVVEDGLQDVADFFRNIFKDIASIFEASGENTHIDESGRSPAQKYMVETNVIPRTEYKEDTVERAPITESGVFESHAQGSKPQVFEHTTESENDWDEEVIEVVKEIFHDHDNEPVEISGKEKFRNLLDDVSDQATHVHEVVE